MEMLFLRNLQLAILKMAARRLDSLYLTDISTHTIKLISISRHMLFVFLDRREGGVWGGLAIGGGVFLLLIYWCTPIGQ